MADLKSFLEQYATSNRRAFSLGDATESRPSRTEQAKEGIGKILTRSNRVFRIWLAFAVAVFVVCGWAVIQNLSNEVRVQAILGGTGLSIGSIVYFMHQLWKEKNAAEIILLLLDTVDEKEMPDILKAFIEKL